MTERVQPTAPKQRKTPVILLGQTPPPWHGQAVATQILFDHDWPEFEVHRLRMEFSEEMHEVGRFQWKKLTHLRDLILKTRRLLKANPGAILFYPPASAKWIPFLRDVFFLGCTRYLAGRTVFIYHASGLPVFSSGGPVRRLLSRVAYHHADLSLEVAQEVVPPHRVFRARSWQWCPCAIAVPDIAPVEKKADAPLVVLFVGSLQEGKGVLQILETAAILRDQGHAGKFLFRIVGKWISPDFEKQVRETHARLGLGDLIELTGQLTGDDKWRAYAEADVFFFPTHYPSEATPIVLMEALGAGLPIISTQWAGIPAMLEGCTTAELHPVKSPGAYASALLATRERQDSLVETSAASRSFYQANFLPRRFVERVERALSGLSLGKLSVQIYLADQNPKLGRSLGISRMTEVVFGELSKRDDASLSGISSRTSLQPPVDSESNRVFPWGTRNLVLRVLTDHLHPLLAIGSPKPDLWYFPKGFLPRLHRLCTPSVVTIHDTIIQYYSDHYPEWRTETEYTYWASMLKHTLRHADGILTVSKSARHQIVTFMERHGIPPKDIHVTYEPCLYESIPQPVNPPKQGYALHLGSREPHKRTAWLIREWVNRGARQPGLPALHVVGSIPEDVEQLADGSPLIVRLPFLDDDALRAQFSSARALILPSEIEGFGLPAIEAYYLGTPVCYTQGTSIEEVLEPVTTRGGFRLEEPESLFLALDDVSRITPEEIHDCGLKLREIYAASSVADRMIEVFRFLKRQHHRTP
ncbi:MAG: glycosyltransferase [Verrucomicrobiaceae bacterium]|nr:MAG: glycosyltransferase [Verrucomicrobiaceae bacterium]